MIEEYRFKFNVDYLSTTSLLPGTIITEESNQLREHLNKQKLKFCLDSALFTRNFLKPPYDLFKVVSEYKEITQVHLTITSVDNFNESPTFKLKELNIKADHEIKHEDMFKILKNIRLKVLHVKNLYLSDEVLKNVKTKNLNELYLTNVSLYKNDKNAFIDLITQMQVLSLRVTVDQIYANNFHDYVIEFFNKLNPVTNEKLCVLGIQLPNLDEINFNVLLLTFTSAESKLHKYYF